MQDVELAWGAATDTGQRAENQDSSVARPPVLPDHVVRRAQPVHAARPVQPDRLRFRRLANTPLLYL